MHTRKPLFTWRFLLGTLRFNPNKQKAPMKIKPVQSIPGLVDFGFVSWLELAYAGASLSWRILVSRVVVRLMALQYSQAWWGVTLHDRWLRGGNGAVTIFVSLPAVDRFLRLLNANRFNVGEHCEHGLMVAGQAQEVYPLSDCCRRCQRDSCGAAHGQDFSLPATYPEASGREWLLSGPSATASRFDRAPTGLKNSQPLFFCHTSSRFSTYFT